MTGALAALDIALWDLKGKASACRSTSCSAAPGGRSCPSMPRSAATRTARWTRSCAPSRRGGRPKKPAAIKIRWDGDRTRQDYDIPGDIAKAKAVRKLVGDDFPLGLRCQQPILGRRRHPRRPRARGSRLHLVRGAGPALRRARDGRGGAAARHHRLRRRADLHHAGAGRPDQRRRAHGPARHRQDGRHHRPDAVRRDLLRPRRRAGAAPDPAEHRPRRQPACAGDADAQHQAGRVRRPRYADACRLRESAGARGRALHAAGRAGARASGARGRDGAPP